jgi:hypothetical protein
MPSLETHTYKVIEDCLCCDHSSEPKRIVISFDGTGGEPGWAVQPRDLDGTVHLYKSSGGLSNVCKLHLIAGGNIGNTHAEFPNQIPIYYSGVGTRGMFRTLKSAIGFGAMADIYEMAHEDVEKIYKEGDELFIFGFSRGAATARLFASYLGKKKVNGLTPTIAFLGVYDTVVESLRFGVSDAIKNVDVEGKDSELPEYVKRAVHFVSIDEYRSPFIPTLFNKDPRVTEIWCPGIHSDVGGGYYHDGLSDNVLKLMQMEAEKAGLVTREITAEVCENGNHTIIAHDKELPGKGLREFDKDMKVEPDATDPDIHDEMGSVYVLLNWWKGFTHRILKTVHGDKPTQEPILILDSTLERIEKWKPLGYVGVLPAPYEDSKYRPKNLLDIPYKIVSSKDMSVSDTVYKNFASAGWQ